MSDLIRIRLEDMRRFATDLVSRLGVAPRRAASLAAHLLWFDAAGASTFGIATLPRWLERIDGPEFDLATEGKVMTERNGTAMLDGENGLPPLVLERVAGLAVEKAREAGIGLVRVAHLGPTGSAAVLAAEMAIGPMAAVIVGPGPSWSLAMPSAQGLPAVFDSTLAGSEKPPPSPPAWPDGLGPWAAVLMPEGGWLIAAIAINAWEPLPAFHARVEEGLGDRDRGPGPGQILPASWEARRRHVREHGVPLPASVLDELTTWARRLGVVPLASAPR